MIRRVHLGTMLVAVLTSLAPACTRGAEFTVVWPSEYENAEAPDGGGGITLPHGGRNQWLIPSEAFSLLLRPTRS